MSTGMAPLLDLTHTTPQAVLGQEFIDLYGRIYKYVKGAGTIAQYEYVVISKDGNYTIASLDTDTSGHGAGKVQPLGCVQVSGGFTSSLYGWIFVGCGIHTGLFAASCVQNVPLYATSTQGVIDDSATTTLIPGLMLITTITGAASASAYAAGRLYTSGV